MAVRLYGMYSVVSTRGAAKIILANKEATSAIKAHNLNLAARKINKASSLNFSFSFAL